MFFAMKIEIIDGRVYQYRVGKMTPSFRKACTKISKQRGFVVDESGKLCGQAYDKRLPKYIGE